MQRFSGLLLMIAGAGFAAYHLLPNTNGGAEQLAEVTRISAAPDRDVAAVPAGPRTFSSASPLLPSYLAATASPVTTKPPAQPPAAWTTVVIADPASPAASRLKSSKPGDYETRAELARDLQRELTRVGCYGGEINGAWTSTTRRAMAAFMERVNASLPIKDPDYILLTLVQGQTSIVCGAACPAGQIATDNGSCVPQAVMAQATRKAKRDDLRRRDAEARQLADARRAPIAPDAMQQPNAQHASGAEVIASAVPEDLPWLKEDRALAAAAIARPIAPLPGRMTVGALAIEPPAVGVARPDRFGRAQTDDKPAVPAGSAISDDKSHGLAVIVPPAPHPATRPAHNESVLDRVATIDAAQSDVDVAPLPPVTAIGKKIAKRPSLGKRKKYYAYAGGGYSYGKRSRRGLPRPGSMPYLIMQSMGGGGFY